MKRCGVILLVMIGGAAAILLPQTLAQAQSTPTIPPLAAVTAGQLVIYGAPDNTRSVVDICEPEQCSQLTWSLDGETLVYISTNAEGVSDLKLAHFSGGSAETLVPGIKPILPITLDPVTGEVLYVERATDATPSHVRRHLFYADLFAIPPSSGATPTLKGRYELEYSGCYTYSLKVPPFWEAYRYESGKGNSWPVLRRVGDNLLYSRVCDNRTLFRLNLTTGNSTALVKRTTVKVLSPDGTQVMASHAVVPLGESYMRLSIFDTATGSQTIENLDISKASGSSTMNWNADNTAIFLTVSYRINTGPTYPTELQPWFSDPIEHQHVDQMNFALVRLDLATNTSSWIYHGDGAAIGRILLTPDPNVILFSVVPDDTVWVAAVVNGEADPDDTAAMYRLHPIALYQFNLLTNEAVLLGEDMGQAALNTAHYPDF
jgi:hypothetical protein